MATSGHPTLYGVFDHEHPCCAATAAVRRAGHHVVDAWTPYPVHGMDDAMGLRRSRLPIVCFLLGLAGGVGALAFQLWVFTQHWQLNVGGKSYTAIPALIPIAFEVTILCAALGSVLVFFARSRLFPGRDTPPPLPAVTDDRFVVGVCGEAAAVRALLMEHGALEVRGGEEPTREEPTP